MIYVFLSPALSFSSHPHADGKFYSQQNTSGDWQQKWISAFSETTEVNGGAKKTKHKMAPQSFQKLQGSKIDSNSLFQAEYLHCSC